MLSAFAVFLPWLAIALAVSLLLCVSDLVARVARLVKYRADFAQAIRGRSRRYAVTFSNHRGF